MQNCRWNKVFVLAIICLFIGVGITSGISGSIKNKKEIVQDLKPSQATDWWPMFHHDNLNSGNSSSLAPEDNNIFWNYTTGGVVHSSPAVIDGKVYVGSGHNNKMYCLNAYTGEFIWNYTAGGRVYSSPAVADGKVYFGSYDDKIYCLYSNNGTWKWDYDIGGSTASSPAIYDGKLYIGSYYPASKVVCLNAETGAFIWSFKLYGNSIYSSPAATNGKVYFGSDTDNTYCLNANNGALIWNFTLPGIYTYMSSSPAISDNKVYINANDGDLYCLNADNGALIWNSTIGFYVTEVHVSSPAVANGKVYVGSEDYSVYCLDADNGDILWEFPTGDVVSSSPAVADGKVYVGSDDSKIYCLDALNGTKIWDYKTSSYISCSPAVANGNVYIGSGGKVYCFGRTGGNLPPEANFIWSPQFPEPGDTVTFNASTSYDPDGYITVYEWDFDNDNQYDDATGISPTWQWSEEGNFPVSLRVTDNESAKDNRTKIVSVISGPEPYFFIHLTDTHVGTTGGLERFTYVKNCIINNMNPHPEFIIISGDLTHWGWIPWKNPIYWWNEFHDVVQDFIDNDIAVYGCMGNHDYFPIIAPDLPEEGISIVPSYNLNLFALESGGTVDYIEGWKRLWPFPIYEPILDWIPEANGLNQGQVTWLSDHIDDYPSYYKVIFMHHPVFCDVSSHNYNNSFDETIKNGCIMNSREDFIELCRNNIDIILSGHIHTDYEYLEGNESSNFLPSLNWINDPNDPDYMGYHGAPGWGYWSISDIKDNNFDLPAYILTGACSQNLEFRKITVKEDDLLIWDDMRWYESEELIEYEMDWWQIILPWEDQSNCTLGNDNITAPARLHLYDSKGNHVGINESGEIDFEIPDAYYENEPIFNQTTGECINWTDNELINVLYNDTESFIFQIEGIINCTLNLTGSYTNGRSGGEKYITYENITFYHESIGKIYVNNRNDNHTLFIDDNGDNITDREIDPTYINYPPNKPNKPTGPPSGKKDNSYTFSSSSTDDDGDQLYYWFDWGDGKYQGPLGPYNSGDIVTCSHIWSEKGDYKVRVKCVDNNSRESIWSDPAGISIPKSKSFKFNFPLLNWLLERFPNMFPILRHMLEL
jgi:outer membrane protein assembly factor BamB